MRKNMLKTSHRKRAGNNRNLTCLYKISFQLSKNENQEKNLAA